MKTAQAFEDLIVWQKAHQLVLNVYMFTNFFPKSEIYGLTSQLRRATVSIPSNIAEGFKKSGSKDKLRFYNIAQGSIEEVKYYLILVNDLEYGDSESLKMQIEEVSKLLHAYSKNIKNSFHN